MSNVTTVLSASQGSGFSLANGLWVSPSGAGFSAARAAWVWNGSAWEGRYSTPSVSCGNVSGSNSDVTPTGSVTSSSAAPSIGGTTIGSTSYAWSYVSGNTNIACSNASASNPTWSYGAVGGTISAIWQLVVTDNQTGATSSCQISISLTWTDTWVPFQQVLTSSQTVGVPRGASSMTWEVIAGGGAGGAGHLNISTGDIEGGGGGGSGGYTTGGAVSISPSDWGVGISCTVGAGGSPSLSQPGNPSSISGSVSGGTVSGSATGGGAGVAATNSPGAGGTAGSPNGAAGGGGLRNVGGTGGDNGQGHGTGGTGGASNGGGQGGGADGAIIINWS